MCKSQSYIMRERRTQEWEVKEKQEKWFKALCGLVSSIKRYKDRKPAPSGPSQSESHNYKAWCSPLTAYNEWRDVNLYQHVKRPQSSVLIPGKLARRRKGIIRIASKKINPFSTNRNVTSKIKHVFFLSCFDVEIYLDNLCIKTLNSIQHLVKKYDIW